MNMGKLSTQELLLTLFALACFYYIYTKNSENFSGEQDAFDNYDSDMSMSDFEEHFSDSDDDKIVHREVICV